MAQTTCFKFGKAVKWKKTISSYTEFLFATPCGSCVPFT